jgi:hypothetical protein
MRFRYLSLQTTEELWNRWEYPVERILCDFNEEVLGGTGRIRKSPYSEKSYVVVETRKLFLCIFPVQGNLLALISFHGCFKKEYLSLDYAARNFECENLIGVDKFSLTRAEQSCKTSEDRTRYLEWALKYFHAKFWSVLSV